MGTTINFYVIMKNNDFTEGKGPMLEWKYFRSHTSAQKYFDQLVGAYGETGKKLKDAGWYRIIQRSIEFKE